MHLLTVVGARPQFVKAAMVGRAISERAAQGADLRETLLHTGQHYDADMSRVFFEQMEIPEPDVNLNVGSGSHGQTTGAMLAGIEREIMAREPDMVLVHGDTNSTLAGALAAAKLHVPVAHVESGLRSFNRRMPEEVNRVLTDHVADLLFCPTQTAVDNLAREGLTANVHVTGDVMYDAALHFKGVAEKKSTVLDDLNLAPGSFFLATVHRAENTDDPELLGDIFKGLGRLTQEADVVLPLHPRTRNRLEQFELMDLCEPLRILPPAGYLDMIRLESSARAILTDSGGVQKEGVFHAVPVVTLRQETEWVETVEYGWNTLVGADPERMVRAALAAGPGRPLTLYGDGAAAMRMVDVLLDRNA